MHRAMHGAARQQVDARAPQLAGARAGEHESQPRSRLDEFVHDVEQGGHPLHFVEHDHPRIGDAGDQFAESLGPRPELPLRLRLQKVDAHGIREQRPNQRGLAGAARA